MHFYFQKLKKFYTISTEKEETGSWKIARRYGRIGWKGRTIFESYSSQSDVEKRLQNLVHHRTHARGYKLMSISL